MKGFNSFNANEAIAYESENLQEVDAVLRNSQLLHIFSTADGFGQVYFRTNETLYVFKFSPFIAKDCPSTCEILWGILNGRINNSNLDHDARQKANEIVINYWESIGNFHTEPQHKKNLKVLNGLDNNKKLSILFNIYYNWVVCVNKKEFIMTQAEKEVYARLFAYILEDEQLADMYSIKLQKGIALLGTVGVGKTSFFYFRNWLMNNIEIKNVNGEVSVGLFISRTSTQTSLIAPIQSCSKDIVETFLRASSDDLADATMKKYTSAKEYVFDDLGVENTSVNRFGTISNVMADIFTARYELYEKFGTKTFFTSNLMTSDIKQSYGARVADRLRSMCNVVIFPQDSESKRV